MLLMALSVMFMLTACNGDENSNKEQAPVSVSETPETLVKNQSECWQTEVVNVLYDLMGQTALKTYNNTTGGALALMMVGFALWLSLRLVKHVGSFKEETMGEVWTEIAKMFFLCLVCGIIASQKDLLVLVLSEVIFPIYTAFLEFAGEILNVAAPATSANVSVNLADISVFGYPVHLGHDFSIESTLRSCKVGKLDAITANSTGFPDSPKVMMNCMICSISDSLSFGMILAFKTLQGPHFVGYVVGILVLLIILFVKLGFVFYLVDTIFRFTVMVVMLPILIMFYPFKSTRELLSSGVKTMLNSAGFMMFFAIIIAMAILALSSILKQFQNVFADDDLAFSDFSVPFICMMMIGFMLISSLNIAGKLCDSFIGGNSNSNFQKTAKALIIGTVFGIISFGLRIAFCWSPTARKLVDKAVNKVKDGVEFLSDSDDKEDGKK